MKYLFPQKFQRLNPFAVVTIIALLVIVVTMFARHKTDDSFNAEVVYTETTHRGARVEEQKPALRYDTMKDPNMQTADRVRDASSLTLVAGLYWVNEFIQKHPRPATV